MSTPFHDVLVFQVGAEQLSLFPVQRLDAAILYRDLIKEEYRELQEAIASGVNKDILHESLDLIWVVIGLCNSMGYLSETAWKELVRANMDKLQRDPNTGELLRHPNGKIKKPENWKGPNFSSFVAHDLVNNYLFQNPQPKGE